jgi:hypothetical protein
MLPSKEERDKLLAEGEEIREKEVLEGVRAAAEKRRAAEAAEQKRIGDSKEAIRKYLPEQVAEACLSGKHSVDIFMDTGSNCEWCSEFAEELRNEFKDYSFEVAQRNAKRQSYRETKGGEDYEIEEYTVLEQRLIVTWE